MNGSCSVNCITETNCTRPSLSRLYLIKISDNPDRKLKSSVHSWVHVLRRCMGFRSKRTFRLCWGQLERLKPHKKILQDWLKLNEGDPGFQLLTEEEIVTVVVFLSIFTSTAQIIREPGQRSLYSDWLRAGRPRNRSSSPGRVNNFLFFTSSRPALGSTQPLQWVPGALSPGREAEHSSPASAGVKKMWIYTSTPPYAFMA
jgi:hypothetical protein